jgi:hypothetical protein
VFCVPGDCCAGGLYDPPPPPPPQAERTKANVMGTAARGILFVIPWIS